jgi:hypothetical protein
VPPWLTGGLDPEGRALAVVVAGAAGCEDAGREEAGADGDVVAGCGGTFTTAGVAAADGGAARAKLAALPGQRLAAAPHPAVVGGEVAGARPDDTAGVSAPRAR